MLSTSDLYEYVVSPAEQRARWKAARDRLRKAPQVAAEARKPKPQPMEPPRPFDEHWDAPLRPLAVSFEPDWDGELYMPPVRAPAILRFVFRWHGIGRIDGISHRRTKHLVAARQAAMWMIREHTGLSLPAIGRLFGGRDHTTVLHAVRKIDAAIAEGTELGKKVKACEVGLMKELLKNAEEKNRLLNSCVEKSRNLSMRFGATFALCQNQTSRPDVGASEPALSQPPVRR